jgi:WD40 repeat protein
LRDNDTPLRSGAFSPDGTKFVTVADGGNAMLWDTASAKRPRILHGGQTSVESAAFSPDGTQFVTAARDGVRVWDAATGALSRAISCCAELESESWTFSSVGLHAQLKSAAFSPDGLSIVTVDDDLTVRTYDAATAKLVRVAHLEPGLRIMEQYCGDHISSAAFSPDGRTIVTAGQDETCVWNSLTGKDPLELNGHDEPVRAEAFSPDGTRIVTASVDGTARTWDARTGSPLLVLRGGDGPVLSAAFSPDGQRIATAARAEARVWDAQTGASLFTLRGHSAAVTSATFSSDGSKLLTTSLDGSARIWQLPPRCQALIDQMRQTLPRQLSDDERRAEFLGPRPAAPVVDFFASQERCST